MTTLVDCPNGRQGDWYFRLFGIDVTVKIWFWIGVVLLAVGRELGGVITWVAVCLGSILLHEYGHVVAFRLFGEDSEIVLYLWGGMAIPRRAPHGTLTRFVIALAGPAAGFCVAGLAIGTARLSGWTVHLTWYYFLPVLAAGPVLGTAGSLGPVAQFWYTLINDLLFVNFYWGLVNLLPIYPLDGGHAARAVLEQYDPFGGRRKSLILSIAVAAAIVFIALPQRNMYLVLMFAILGVSSAQLLEDEPRRPLPDSDRSWRS
ncbi:MAG TPA: site-2 protease family protein [Bryobacteraceae bacterium]|jgi:Zn-dependent protease